MVDIPTAEPVTEAGQALLAYETTECCEPMCMPDLAQRILAIEAEARADAEQARLDADRREARTIAAAFWPYLRHNPTTHNGEAVPGSPCTCGLNDVLNEVVGE